MWSNAVFTTTFGEERRETEHQSHSGLLIFMLERGKGEDHVAVWSYSKEMTTWGVVSEGRQDVVEERGVQSKCCPLFFTPYIPSSPSIQYPPVNWASQWNASPQQPSYSHDGAAFGLILVESGGEQLRLAGQVEEPLGQAAGGARFGWGLQLVEAGQGCCAEYTVDALLWGESWTLQVGLRSQLLSHGWTLQPGWQRAHSKWGRDRQSQREICHVRLCGLFVVGPSTLNLHIPTVHLGSPLHYVPCTLLVCDCVCLFSSLFDVPVVSPGEAE